jgi:hypothetical protein
MCHKYDYSTKNQGNVNAASYRGFHKEFPSLIFHSNVDSKTAFLVQQRSQTDFHPHSIITLKIHCLNFIEC